MAPPARSEWVPTLSGSQPDLRRPAAAVDTRTAVSMAVFVTFRLPVGGQHMHVKSDGWALRCQRWRKRRAMALAGHLWSFGMAQWLSMEPRTPFFWSDSFNQTTSAANTTASGASWGTCWVGCFSKKQCLGGGTALFGCFAWCGEPNVRPFGAENRML